MKKALFILISFLFLVQSVFSASSPTEKELNDFVVAINTGNAEYVENFLRSYHYDVNDDIKFDDEPVLVFAALKGHTEVVSVLLKNGADVNAKTNDGYTALMYAAYNGHTDVISVLLKNKADVNAQSNEGVTALMLAAQVGHTDVISVLLKNKADINAKTNDIGQTALMYAAITGHTDVISVLLKNKADVNAKQNEGWTASMYAAQNGHTDIETELKKNEKGSILSAMLAEYEKWTTSRFIMQAKKNVGKKICLKDAVILSIDGSNSVSLSDKHFNNTVHAIFDELLEEQILLLKEESNYRSFYNNIGVADYYGSIETIQTDWGTEMQVLHIVFIFRSDSKNEFF